MYIHMYKCYFPRWLKALGFLLLLSKEGKGICEIDGWVLGGMQFAVLGVHVHVLFWVFGSGAGAFLRDAV